MAKKTVRKTVKNEIATPCGLDYKPSLHLDLEGTDVKQVEGLKVGEEVQIMVIGKLKRVTQEKRKRYDYEKSKEGPEVQTASLSVEDYKIVVVEDEKNEFAEMAADDEASE